MAINDKLNRIKEIKEDIKQALIDKGVEVTDEDSFGSYADKITNIPQEGGGDPYYEDLYNLRTSNGTNMSGLFAYAKGDNLDLTGLDVSKCTSMYYMFSDCDIKNVDITGWDTGNVQDITYMFDGSTISNINGLSELKFPNVTKYENIFYTGKMKYIDLSGWDINNVTRLSYLVAFGNTEKIDLTNWNTRNITYMSNVFYSLSYLTDLIIPDWDMTNVTSSSKFIYSTENLRYIDLSRSNDLTINKIISFIPTRTEAAYGEMKIPADSSQEVIDALISKYWKPIGPALYPASFEISSELDEVRPGQQTKVICHSRVPWYSSLNNVEFISSDESIATVNENGEITAVSLGSVEIYARLKNNPDVVSNTITIAISETDSTPYVIKFKSLYTPTTANTYSEIECNSVDRRLKNMEYDENTGVFTLDVGEPITKIKFSGSSSADTKITEILKFDFNGNNITDMTDMFSYLGNIEGLNKIDNISNWDVSNVTSMKNLFYNSNISDFTCIEENWDVRTTSISGMFISTPVETINLSHWYLDNVHPTSTTFATMFSRCSSLREVKLPKVDVPVQIHGTFLDCVSLELVDLTGIPNTGAYGISFTNVPSTCKVYVRDDTWTVTETELGFTGTFIRVNPEYYTEYSIDSSTATFNMRSIDSINSGAYLPELSNGYDAVLLTLNDGSITTDLNTEANQVSSIKIYYPEETSYVKFANTKVKEVNHLSGSNITDCTGMFTNCIYLEKADLTSLDSTKVTVDTSMFEGVSPEAEVTFNESWDIPKSDMGRGEQEENPYYVEYTINTDNASGKTVSNSNSAGTPYLPKINDKIPTNVTITLKDGTTTNNLETLVTDVERIRVDYDENTQKVTFGYPYKIFTTKCKIQKILHINTHRLTDMNCMFHNCENISLDDFDFSDWDTSNVTDMSNMFNGCSSPLYSMNLSSFDTRNVTKCEGMLPLKSTLPGVSLQIHVGPNWTLTEEQTGFTGTFTRV